MAISNTQARRIREGRKNLQRKKEEFFLKPIKPSSRQQVTYTNKLLKAVDDSKRVVMELYANVSTLEGFDEVLDRAFENMTWWDDFEATATEQVFTQAETQAEEFYESIKTAAGVNVAGFVSEQGLGDLLDAIVDSNVTQITDLNANMQQRVSEIVKNALIGQESKSPTLEKQIRDTFTGPTANEARFIARDQTQRAVNGLNQFRQERSGIKKYKWATSKDNRVRDKKGHNHKIMDGLEVDWATGKILSTPLSRQRGVAGKNVKNVAGGHVGAEYQCRCNAIPILEI